MCRARSKDSQRAGNVNKKLMDRETEVIDLQKKVIELFEELTPQKIGYGISLKRPG
jgi:hypothetical protein